MISQSNHMMSVAKRWCWSRNGHTQNWLNTVVTTKIILKSSTGLFTLHDESTWIWWIRIGMCLLSCYYVRPLLHIQRSLDLKIAEIPRLCYIDTNLISIQNQGSGITSAAWARSWHLSCNTSIHEQRWWNTLCFFRRVWKREVQIPKDSCLGWDTIWKLKLLPTEDDQVSEYINQMTRSN